MSWDMKMEQKLCFLCLNTFVFVIGGWERRKKKEKKPSELEIRQTKALTLNRHG